DRWRLTAQLKSDAFHCRGAVTHDAFANSNGARKRDLVHVWIAHELRAYDMPPPRDDIENTLRQFGLMESLDQHSRLQCAQLARLDYDRTARGNGRGQFEANEKRISIPRGDQA